MSLQRFAVLGALAVLPAVAQVYNASISPQTTTELSRVWSGYVATGAPGSVTDVKGSWIVPTVTCPVLSSGTAVRFWVGIDGEPSVGAQGTVEQIGIGANCVNFIPVYFAWYEFYPAPMAFILQPISPGDEISAEVSYSTAAGLFTVTLTDVTTGDPPFSMNATAPSALRASAEWITEAPALIPNKVISPLADFGTVLYGQDNTPPVTGTCYATVGTQTGPIALFATLSGSTLSAITMTSDNTSSGLIEAAPSSLSVDGSSFSVTWHGTTLLSDNFKKDSGLKTKLWTTSSAFLTALATASSSPPAAFVVPQLTFSSTSGMQTTGPTQDYQTTGVQSLSTFTAPFTVTTNVTATQGTGDPFEIFLASADLKEFLTVTANVNPTYYGMWATAQNISQLWQLGDQFSPPIAPAFNTTYRIVISVDASGAATVKVENASGRRLLGSVSNLQPGTGPFYLVLGQRIGNAPTGSQVANWSFVKVTTP